MDILFKDSIENYRDFYLTKSCEKCSCTLKCYPNDFNVSYFPLTKYFIKCIECNCKLYFWNQLIPLPVKNLAKSKYKWFRLWK